MERDPAPTTPVSSQHADYVRIFKPAPPHNSLLAPAVCMCLDCCRIVLDLRCPATNEDGIQCGDYKGHKKSDGHTMLVCSSFLCAEERLQIDGRITPNEGGGSVGT